MPKRAAATDAPAPLGKRRSKPPQRYHEQAAAQIPEDDASDSDEPEGLARFTPAALDEPSKAVRKSLQKKQDGRERRTDPGVIYLGHIPHGFYEKQMKSFFSQFGEVSKLRLSRNKKTGRSRHYAFIEFEDRHVATVVAETMDNYLLCNKQLVCKLVDPEKLHERIWVGANKKFQQVPWRSIARKQHNDRRTAQQQQQRQAKLVRKETKKRQKLAELGIEYDFDGYKELLPKKAQKTKF